jgi:ribulose-phosphate 3-epimerase
VETRIAPSILSADFARLSEQVATVLDAGAKVIHCDVMDGHFVPPITFGPLVVEAIAGQVHEAGAFVDVHLMIERPERHVESFAKAGADGITIHFEASPHTNYALNAIHDAGCKAGLAINPGTPADALAEVVDDFDLALCMTVNPGWGGQPFIKHSIEKVRRLRELVGPDRLIEVDGGIDPQTAPLCAEAGANWFVAGSSIFGAPNPAAAYKAIADALGGA